MALCSVCFVAVGGGGDGEVVTEQQLVEALTEHAHAIASTVLTQTGHGRDLGNDAQVSNMVLVFAVQIIKINIFNTSVPAALLYFIFV